MKITITTAQKLDASQLKSISAALSKKLNSGKLDLTQVVDETLIGGIKIAIGSVEYDGSIKAKLAAIKQELHKIAS